MIIGNKMDLEHKREVSYEEAAELARQSGFPYMECSAKSGKSIEEVFNTLGKMMKESIIDVVEK